MPRRRTERGAARLITRSESPFIQIQWYDPIKRRLRLKSTGTISWEEAQERLAKFLGVRNGNPGAGEGVGNQDRASEEAAEFPIAGVVRAFYQQHAEDQAQGPAVRAAVRWFTEFFGARPVKALYGDEGGELIQEYVYWRAEEGRSLATVTRELATLRTALNSLARAYPGLVIPEIPSLGEYEGRLRWLTHEEAMKLRTSCKFAHTWLFIELGLATGSRPTALFELKWDQIDFDGRLIHLNPNFRRQTSKRRPSVKMTDRIFEILQRMRKGAPEATYVIEVDEQPIKSIKNSFRSAVEKAKLNPKEVTPYTLRHTAAAWLVQAGVPLFEVAAFLGHKDTRMVEKFYGKLAPDYQEKAKSALDNAAGEAPVAPQKHLKKRKGSAGKAAKPLRNLVEPDGIEPTTSTMPL